MWSCDEAEAELILISLRGVFSLQQQHKSHFEHHIQPQRTNSNVHLCSSEDKFSYFLHMHICPYFTARVVQCPSGSALFAERCGHTTLSRSQSNPLYKLAVKWGPWSFLVSDARAQREPDHGAISASALQACIVATAQTRAYREREETGQTLQLSTGVIDSWVSRTLIPPGDNTKAPSPPAGNLTPILWQKESKSSVRHSLMLTDTFLCPCFTFRKVRGGSLTVEWKYIVCNYHWQSRRQAKVI